ncbi:MAG TPA: OpgC domain-containing protein [Caldimonas sp.]|jgi:hypothetical protein|nr:OpgC domain-containing protein [Caldimonas sp.]HEX2539575.1 OpgC domain-containing protein [Caldimonas sp.]
MSEPRSDGGGKPSGRLWQIDALRGVMLVLMTITHVPTRFVSPLGQPFGYVSAAEGFVLLSAFMAGWIYTEKQLKSGFEGMRTAFLKRVLKIYLSQAALLFFLFFAVAMIGLVVQQEAVTNLVSFFLQQPIAAFVGALLLVYNPPLLDILPMYILFMLASPLALVQGAKHGWLGLLVGSGAIWLATQFGLSRALYDTVVHLTGLPIPLAETGAFHILAWQMIWMLGLWMGACYANGTHVTSFPRWLVASAAAVALTGLVWRHAVGQAPFLGDVALNMLFDKWQLGPLRVINLLALVALVLHFGPWLKTHLPRLRVLETLGAASLPVFCAHLVLALLALTAFGVPKPERPWAIDVAILATCFVVLYLVALVSERIDRHAAEVRARFAAARAARARARQAAGESLSEGARRSPTSTERSQRR